jgi:hypothetical protein
MVYSAFRQAQRDPGPWLGAPVEFKRDSRPSEILPISSFRNVPYRGAFDVLGETASRRYLDHRKISVSEHDQKGNDLSSISLEYIEPHTQTGISNNTVSVVPLMRDGSETYIGLELRDLPAPQLHGYSSSFYAIPAYRLPKEIQSIEGAGSFISERMSRDFGVLIEQPKTLGGRYFPTAGLTPETVYPFFTECFEESAVSEPLHWFKLTDVVQSLGYIRGGHTLTGLNRISHALGLLQPTDPLGL